MTLPPHAFWQQIYPPGTLPGDAVAGYQDLYPACLPDGRQIAFPIRTLPGDGTQGVASLILNQAAFPVADALADVLATRLAQHRPQVILGLPTLGLGLAEAVARRLGHSRMVPMGTSRKFWYDEALSEPLSSITTPGQGKRLYLDPRMLPVLSGQRVVLVDDVASSGSTLRVALGLLAKARIAPVACGFAMLQGRLWAAAVPPDLPVEGAVATPRLRLGADARWRPDPLA